MKRTLLFLLSFVATFVAKADGIELPATATQIMTLKGTVGEEVSITLGVYANEDVYAVDFGDGVQKIDSVGNQNSGIKGDDGKTKEGTAYTSATKFAGTVAGDGTIKVYGTSDLWYLNTNGPVIPSSFDQPGMAKVVQMNFTGADVESIALPATEYLKQFTCNNSSLKSIDLTKATALTSLTINSTSASKFEPQLESIDVSKNTELTYLSLQGNQNNHGKLTSLDLSNNTKLQGMGLYVQYNQIANLTLPAEWAPDEESELGQTITYGLTTINVQNNQLTALNTANLKKMKQIYAADNQLTSIDVSDMAALVWLDVKNNQLSGDIDLTALAKLTNVYLNNNQLTSVKVTDVTKQFYVDGNKLTLATLPSQPASMNTTSKTKQFHYAPQAAYEVPELAQDIDLSSLLTVEKGELNPNVVGDQGAYTTWLTGTTTYSFVTASGIALVEGTDYEVTAPGKFKFLKDQTEKVHAEMLNAAFPKFTATTPFKSTDFTVAVTPILTLKGTVGEEASLTFGVWDTEDSYGVDFGDGNIQVAKVGIDNKGPVKEDGTTAGATKFTGTVAGDGTIKVYGVNDVWYLIATNGVMPTAFDQSKLMNVVQMSITGADVESVALPAYPKMTQFSFNNSSVKSVDVSKVTTLTSLTINNTSASKFTPQLESIDLSKNTELTYLSLQGNNKNSGKLTTLDLTNNTKLDGMGLYVQYNELEEVKLAENTLSMINVQNNQLSSLDLTKMPNLKSLYASDNKLTTLNFSKLAAGGDVNIYNNELTEVSIPVTVKTIQAQNNKLTSVSLAGVSGSNCKFENNQLTLATIPAQPAGMNTANKTKKFTYVPQAALAVDETLSELDLTSQITVLQGELDPNANYASWLGEKITTYRVLLPSGVLLVEGLDYVSTTPGKFRFLKNQTEKIHVMMLNDALPKFTEAAPFVTTEFTVNIPTAIKDIDAAAASGKLYNLQGVEVQQAVKGLYIQNGKKVVLK